MIQLSFLSSLNLEAILMQDVSASSIYLNGLKWGIRTTAGWGQINQLFLSNLPKVSRIKERW